MEGLGSDLVEDISLKTNFGNNKTSEELSEECSETRFSLESQDIDSNQGPLSSGSTEHIQENFQEMGIDNNW
jgi:hypothetical protein